MASDFQESVMAFRGLSDEEGDETEEPKEIEEGPAESGDPEGVEGIL